MKNPTSKRPAFSGRFPKMKTLPDERGVSPVIAVILMVAITVVLASVLYVMVMGIIGGGIGNQPITGAITFDEKEDGYYLGRMVSISADAKIDRVSVSITDASTGNSAAFNPLTDGGIASCGAGQLNLTFRDVNKDGQLDPGDIFRVYNGDEGDLIVFTSSKGGTSEICSAELT